MRIGFYIFFSNSEEKLLKVCVCSQCELLSMCKENSLDLLLIGFFLIQ